MRIEKLVRTNSIWYQMDGQKVKKMKLNIFDCTFGWFCRTFKSVDFEPPGCRDPSLHRLVTDMG